jgi:hypothetical protein
MNDAASGWALANEGVRRIDGEDVFAVSTPEASGTLTDLVADGHGVWVGSGNGKLFYGDGVRWQVDETFSNLEILRLRADKLGNLLVLACSTQSDDRGYKRMVVGQRTGDIWTIRFSRDFATCPRDIDVDESGTTWVVFSHQVWRLDASGKEVVDAGGVFDEHYFHSISAASGSVWVVGQGVILQWTGGQWRPADLEGLELIYSAVTSDLRGIWAQDQNDVWVTGSDGGVLHFDGLTWSLDGRSMTDHGVVNAVTAGQIDSSRRRVWIVAGSGSIMTKDYVATAMPTATTTPTASATQRRSISLPILVLH